MRAELQTNDVPQVAFYRDPRVRAVFYQVVVVLAVVLAGAYLVHNTMANLAKLGVAGGFGFLSRPAGFDIGQALIDYSSSNTFGRAFIVGFLNTILGFYANCAIVWVTTVATDIVRVTSRSYSRSRRAFGRFVIASMSATRRANVHSTTCFARNPGSPISLIKASTSAGIMPRRD